MANSMTGYGRGEAVDSDRRINIEMKSINNRYCDIQIRMPRMLSALENRIREKITQQVFRGKIDVFIQFSDTSAQSSQVVCDQSLAKAYADGLREIAQAASVPEALNASAIARFPDVLKAEPASIDPESVWALVEAGLDQAVRSLVTMRQVEGDRLVSDLIARGGVLRTLREEVVERAPTVVADYRQRLLDRIAELLGDQADELFDEQRLAGEVAVFADKCNIDEELVRLESHLSQLDEILGQSGPIGKKLDFLVQEINREINTIGSKANDIQLVNRVVSMKSELEKIREQIQNLE